MAFAPYQIHRLVEGEVDIHCHDVGARHHHVVRGGAAQSQHIGDQGAFLPVEFRHRPVAIAGIGGLLHQLGDRFPHTVVLAAAADTIAQDAADTVQQGGVGRLAHRRFHGFGTPMLARMRASAISIRRASPTW